MSKYRKYHFKCPNCGHESDGEQGYLTFYRDTRREQLVEHFLCFDDGRAFDVEGEYLDNDILKERFQCAECAEKFSWNVLFNSGAVTLLEEDDPNALPDVMHPENMPDFELKPGTWCMMPVELYQVERRFDGGRGTEFYTFRTEMGTTVTISDHYIKFLKEY